MLLSSVDWALRGATCALVVLIAASLLRDHGRLLAARLAALFAIGTGTYAITSAAGFSPLLGLWTPPARPVGRQQRGVLGIAQGLPPSCPRP
jgi:hypothetical protein